ncbi:MAG: glucuronate isomerase [Firmicutes bacterium]|nr:glucuronate isomerase [Bacillota bacterium]
MAVISELLPETVGMSVAAAGIVDVHTHLYPGSFGDLLLRGIDDLLTYHYLVAETLRCLPLKPQVFYAMSKQEQADLIWKTLFLERSPISEACRGVVTTLQEFGLDTASRDLNSYRAFFSNLTIQEHIDIAFRKANLEAIVMTNDPFDPEEYKYWEEGFDGDPRFKAALRLDPLLNTWASAVPVLQGKGYQVAKDVSERTISEVLRFLEDCSKKMPPLYLAVSLPPDFAYPDASPRGKLIEDAVLPFCREAGLPFALMIGVKKLANPALGVAGDSVGKASIEAVERLCLRNPEIRFLVSMLSRENQHELCVAARKFSNLRLFGCWWFLNNPSLVEEITAMRLELLGTSFIPQHSDARVLDQLIYKWKHNKETITKALVRKYQDLMDTGWVLEEDEIKRDVDSLFRGNVKEALNLA